MDGAGTSSGFLRIGNPRSVAVGAGSGGLSVLGFFGSIEPSRLDLTPFSFPTLGPPCCIFSVSDSFFLPKLFGNPLTSFVPFPST